MNDTTLNIAEEIERGINDDTYIKSLLNKLRRAAPCITPTDTDILIKNLVTDDSDKFIDVLKRGVPFQKEVFDLIRVGKNNEIINNSYRETFIKTFNKFAILAAVYNKYDISNILTTLKTIGWRLNNDRLTSTYLIDDFLCDLMNKIAPIDKDRKMTEREICHLILPDYYSSGTTGFADTMLPPTMTMNDEVGVEMDSSDDDENLYTQIESTITDEDIDKYINDIPDSKIIINTPQSKFPRIPGSYTIENVLEGLVNRGFLPFDEYVGEAIQEQFEDPDLKMFNYNENKVLVKVDKKHRTADIVMLYGNESAMYDIEIDYGNNSVNLIKL